VGWYCFWQLQSSFWCLYDFISSEDGSDTTVKSDDNSINSKRKIPNPNVGKNQSYCYFFLKYQEKSLIVKCFTQIDGLKSYFVPNAFSAKKSNQKIAYFQPFSILEIEAITRIKEL
jgi:hypothetical protein